jgi:hypothetical protein
MHPVRLLLLIGLCGLVAGAQTTTGPLANGTTATTQTAGDNTTKVATDAFVLANAASGGSSAFSTLSGGTNTSATMVVGSGASLAPVGSGTITATSVPFSGVTGTPSTSQVPFQSLTTTGSSGAATLSAGVLNIPQYSGGGGSTALNSITAASGSQTGINNGNNTIQWNWDATGMTSEYMMTFSENTASTASTTPLGLVNVSTLSGSTLTPLTVQNTLTGSQTLPSLQILPVWNTTGNSIGGIYESVTGTANGTGSLLLNLLYNSTAAFQVDYQGNATAGGTVSANKFVSTCTSCGPSQLQMTYNSGTVTEAANSYGFIGPTTSTSFAPYLWALPTGTSAGMLQVGTASGTPNVAQISSVAATNGDCMVGTGGVWAAGSCIGSQYTVSTLPTCNSGSKGLAAAVTDAASPTFLGSLSGGGSTYAPAVCNGSAWVAY